MVNQPDICVLFVESENATVVLHVGQRDAAMSGHEGLYRDQLFEPSSLRDVVR